LKMNADTVRPRRGNTYFRGIARNMIHSSFA
jgi:hypothetical protein